MVRILASITMLRRAAVIAGLCALMGLYLPPASFAADDAAQTDGAAGAAQTNPGANVPGMAGCPGPDGACCGSCQEKAAENKPADQAAGGCPCQRAKQSHKGS